MNKTKLLITGIVILVVLNITLMIILLISKPHQMPHPQNGEGPKHIIIEKLHFNKKQIGKYEVMISNHQEQIKQQEESIRIAKHDLFNLLQQEDYSQKDSIIDFIANTQNKIENIHFNHFNELKMLCNETQLNDFNELSNELARLFAPHPPKH